MSLKNETKHRTHAQERDAAENAADGGNHAIPAPENGGHARSAAAHLGGGDAHTKPAGDQRALIEKNERVLREPPMVVSRVGKQHR